VAVGVSATAPMHRDCRREERRVGIAKFISWRLAVCALVLGVLSMSTTMAWGVVTWHQQAGMRYGSHDGIDWQRKSSSAYSISRGARHCDDGSRVLDVGIGAALGMQRGIDWVSVDDSVRWQSGIGPPREDLLVVTLGWPWSALGGLKYTNSEGSDRSVGLISVTLDRKESKRLLVPTAPILGGLLGDLAVFVAGWWVVVGMATTIYRVRRAIRQECIECGYHHVVRNSACPECGAKWAARGS